MPLRSCRIVAAGLLCTVRVAPAQNVAAPADVVSVEVRDGSGDGKADVVVRFRQVGDGWGREVLEVLSFDGDQARPTLLAEVALFQGESRLDTEVRFVRSGHGQTVEIRAGRARGFTAATFPRRAEDPRVRAIPTPW